MIVAQPRPDETETIAALRALNVLDTKPEVAFDALVRAASLVCGAPISLISLVDVNRQWFKANVGLPGVTETSRDSSFCAHAVLGETLFEVPDASRDPRFADNPLVLGDPHIRFYAGIPLRLHDGRKVGSLCVIDRQPRQLNAQQREVLKALGEAAAHALEGRRAMEASAAAAMEIAQSEALLAEERQRLAAVIDAANVGTWEINLLTGEARVSERWAQITGETVAELGPLTIQNGMGRVHPDDAERVRRTFTEHVKGTSDRYSTELRVRHKDGRWVPVVDHARVMSRTADGQVKWVVGARIDVERRKQSEERLRRSEDFLRRTGRVAGVGGWELDVATRKVTWSDETALIHGKPAGYQPTFEEARSYYTPEALAEIGAAVDRCLAGGPGWDLELPQTRADGVPIWIRSVGSPEVVDGKVVRLVGAFQDVTESVRVRSELKRQNAISAVQAHVAVAANQAHTLQDGLKRCIDVVCQRMGWAVGHAYMPTDEDRELLASSPVWSADPKGLYAAFRAESDRLRFPIGKGLAGSALRDRRPVLMDSLEDNPNFPRKGVAKACGLRWGLAAPVLVGDEVAAVVEFFGSDAATFDRPHIDLVSHVGVQLGRVVDRARARVALEQAAETLREQSVLDELTGLYNRRGFLTLAEERRASARRAGQRAFLLFADLDGMKRINDELGHDAGDVALRETADLLRRTLRKADIVARLGGDEFVALVCETGKFDEGALLRRLELELERLNREKRLPFVLSASFGLAQPEGPDETLAAMIKRADEEMYKAKTARKQARG